MKKGLLIAILALCVLLLAAGALLLYLNSIRQDPMQAFAPATPLPTQTPQPAEQEPEWTPTPSPTLSPEEELQQMADRDFMANRVNILLLGWDQSPEREDADSELYRDENNNFRSDVLMLLAVVFLLYQHEFAVQTIALTLAIASAVLLNHGSSSMPALVTAFCWAAMVLVAALLVLTVMLQKHEGSYKGTVIFPAKTNYALTCAVLVLSIAAIAVSLFAGLAYYVIWGAAVLLFVLAVLYTVKML